MRGEQVGQNYSYPIQREESAPTTEGGGSFSKSIKEAGLPRSNRAMGGGKSSPPRWNEKGSGRNAAITRLRQGIQYNEREGPSLRKER